jgi:hypothetical protein
VSRAEQMYGAGGGGAGGSHDPAPLLGKKILYYLHAGICKKNLRICARVRNIVKLGLQRDS